MRAALVLTLLVCCCSIALGQENKLKIRGTNLLEMQNGNLPELNPDQRSLYDMLDLNMRYGKIGLDTRFEVYYPSFGDPAKSYNRLSQAKLQYKSRNLNVELGSIYPSLGRGLLLRTYEIPASVWETISFRTRYGFYRDLLGVSVEGKLGPVRLKAVRGEVLDVTLPPTLANLEDRRPDFVEAFFVIDKDAVNLTVIVECFFNFLP